MNLPWASLMTKDNTRKLKPDEESRSSIENAGATKDKLVICSCGTGREATNEFNLFKWDLGYPRVKEHEGAFTEWTAHPENPTVLGKNPRDDATRVRVPGWTQVPFPLFLSSTLTDRPPGPPMGGRADPQQILHRHGHPP